MERKKVNLGFVAIVKNEAPYIIEWIEFHKLVGVNRFYIYDNESTDNLKTVLAPYIDSGVVVYRCCKGKKMQNIVYTDAIKKYKNECKYMGFIDVDEFVVPNENQKLDNIIHDILRKDDNAAGVAINWRIYGSSGHEKMPKGLVIENYQYRANDDFDVNKHIKTICNPRKVISFQKPHFPTYKKGFYSIDEDGNTIHGPFNEKGKCKRMQINHYFTKSKMEYVLKALRGKADSKSIRGMSDFIRHDQNDIYDDKMTQYISSVKKNCDDIKRKIPFRLDYMESINNNSLTQLTEQLERNIKKDKYQMLRNALAQMYDEFSYNVEKRIGSKKKSR